MADFTGAAGKAEACEELEAVDAASEGELDLGRGESGSLLDEEVFSEAAEVASATTGKSTGTVLGRSVFGSQRRNRAADNSKTHLRAAGRGRDPECCDADRITVPENRSHWPEGHELIVLSG